MKLIKNNYMYIIIAIASLLLCLGFRNYDIVLADDGVLHYLRVIGTTTSIKEGIIPPLISTHFINELGYSTNIFYNPIVTYIPSIMKLIIFPLSYSTTLKLYTYFTICLSGIFMYKFAMSISKNKMVSLIASIIYISAPYHLTDIYIRFAIGEFTAFIFIPILLQGLYNLFYSNKNESYYITIGATGLVLTHTISLYYMVFLSLIFVVLNFKKLKDKDVIKNILINAIFIALISLFFVIPLLESKLSADYVIFDNKIMNTNGKWVKENALDLEEIFIKNSNTAEDENVLFKIGTPSLIFLFVGIFIYKKIDDKYKKTYILNFVLGILCLFMASKYFPWEILPDALCKIQFPWRMIGFSTVFLSYICAINFYTFVEICIDKKIIKNIFFASIIILIVISGIIDISPYLKSMDNKGNDIEFENNILNNLSINAMQINREYLPIKAFNNLNYINERDDSVKILSGNVEIANYEKEKLTYNFEYKVIDNAKVELPFLYYPCYEVKVNGEKVNFEESSNGLISISLENEGVVSLKYNTTIITKVSYVISFVSFILFIFYKRKMNLSRK